MQPRSAYAEEPSAASRQALRDCERKVAFCLYRLGDTTRREEARGYLLQSLQEDGGLPDSVKAELHKMLGDEPYFAAAGA